MNKEEKTCFEIDIVWNQIFKQHQYVFRKFSKDKNTAIENIYYADNFHLEGFVSFVVKYIIKYNITDIAGPENILRRICNEMKNQTYTAKLKFNDDRIIEVEGLKGHFKCEFVGCDFVSEQKETDEQDCCGECLSDDQELTKDLMLDEVISSQHLEIERLMNIVQDLITTNLRLVEIIGLKK